MWKPAIIQIEYCLKEGHNFNLSSEIRCSSFSWDQDKQEKKNNNNETEKKINKNNKQNRSPPAGAERHALPNRSSEM